MSPNNSLKGVVGRIVSAFDPLGAGTTNHCGKANLKDTSLLINYALEKGPEPHCPKKKVKYESIKHQD